MHLQRKGEVATAVEKNNAEKFRKSTGGMSHILKDPGDNFHLSGWSWGSRGSAMFPTGQVDCAAQSPPRTLRGASYPCSYLTSDSYGLNPSPGTEGCNSFWWNYRRSEGEAEAGHLAVFQAAAMSGWYSLNHIFSCRLQDLLHLDLGHITSLNITYTLAYKASKALICAENTCVYEKQWFSPEYSSICYHKEIHQKLLSSLGQSSLL